MYTTHCNPNSVLVASYQACETTIPHATRLLGHRLVMTKHKLEASSHLHDHRVRHISKNIRDLKVKKLFRDAVLRLGSARVWVCVYSVT